MKRISETKRKVRRIVATVHGEFVVELEPDELVMRPLRHRRGAIRITWGAVYLRALGAPKGRRR